MKCDARIHLQTNVDVMFLAETSLNDVFKVRRWQESGSVLCIQGPFFFLKKKRKKCWVVFSCMLRSFFEQDNAC